MYDPSIADQVDQAVVGQDPEGDLVEELAQDFAGYLAESQASEAGGDPRPPEGGEPAGGLPAQRADRGIASEDAHAVARAFRPAAAASDASEGANLAQAPGPGEQPTRAVEGTAPSLDRYGHSSVRGEWSRQQRRIYHRVNSVLTYWEAHGFQVLWVMLSTAPGGNADKLSYHHKLLREKSERTFGYTKMEHFQVQTLEGHGVLHILWAWRARDGERQRNFSVPQAWLSTEWVRIHGASVVWIKRYRNRQRSRKRLSRYLVTQYCADQSGLIRCAWSWKRTFGFPLVTVWREFRTLYRGPLYAGAVRMWETLMRGETILLGGWGRLTLQGLRLRYSGGDPRGRTG